MRKVLLRDARPDLAEQLVDKSLLDTVGVSDRRKLLWRCGEGHEWDAIVQNRVRKGYGCPYCSGRLAISGKNDLATVYPEIAEQLVDSSLANKLLPTSHKSVEWKCGRGHTWFSPVSTRVANSSGCPYCSGRKAWIGESDLATTHPELAEQLVDKSLAYSIKAGTNAKVLWRCSVCNGEWEASPNSRTHMHSGCPYCAGKRKFEVHLSTLGSDIATCSDELRLCDVRPDLVNELVHSDEANLLTSRFDRRVLWRCSHGHIWEASVSSRVSGGLKCPVCEGNAV